MQRVSGCGLQSAASGALGRAAAGGLMERSATLGGRSR